MAGFSDTGQTDGLTRLFNRWFLFTDKYSHEISKLNPSYVTGQYRLRGVVGLIVTIAFFAFDVGCYSLSTGWTPCHLDGHVAFFTGHIFFQCTRSMGTYYHLGSILVIVLLGLHLILVIVSFFWSVTGERQRPKYKIYMPKVGQREYVGDAAFLFHLMLNSNYGALLTKIDQLGNRDEPGSRRKDLVSSYQVDDSPSGSLLTPSGSLIAPSGSLIQQETLV